MGGTPRQDRRVHPRTGQRYPFPPPSTGKKVMLHRGRYASCGHTGGLTCFYTRVWQPSVLISNDVCNKVYILFELVEYNNPKRNEKQKIINEALWSGIQDDFRASPTVPQAKSVKISEFQLLFPSPKLTKLQRAIFTARIRRMGGG